MLIQIYHGRPPFLEPTVVPNEYQYEIVRRAVFRPLGYVLACFVVCISMFLACMECVFENNTVQY